MLVSCISTILLLSTVIQARSIEPPKQECTNISTDFAESMDGWYLQRGSTDENCAQTPDGLRMRILPPPDYNRLIDPDEKAPYNTMEGTGCTVNATTYMQYGTFSATVKAGNVAGAVTAVILIADNGDEIDFELLAKTKKQITTNYFYGPRIVYGKNGRETDPSNGNVYDEFYTYTIEWSPKKIDWYINGEKIRTKHQSKEYPTHPARVQIGLWDGSGAAGTARWAGGPIDWKARANEPIDAYIKDIKIKCDPQYNIVH